MRVSKHFIHFIIWLLQVQTAALSNTIFYSLLIILFSIAWSFSKLESKKPQDAFFVISLLNWEKADLFYSEKKYSCSETFKNITIFFFLFLMFITVCTYLMCFCRSEEQRNSLNETAREGGSSDNSSHQQMNFDSLASDDSQLYGIQKIIPSQNDVSCITQIVTV